jgi:hypothetical protein
MVLFQSLFLSALVARLSISAHALVVNAIGCEEKPGVTRPTKIPRSRRAETFDRLIFEIGYTTGGGTLQVASTQVKQKALANNKDR